MTTETFTPIAKPEALRGLAMLEATIAEIEAHPSTWNQEHWVGSSDSDTLWAGELPAAVKEAGVPSVDCGTTACLFGHIVFKAGGKLCLDDDAGDFYSGQLVRFGDEIIHIETWARKLLGLPGDHADWLSDGGREWSDILAYRDAWRTDEAVGVGVDEAREAVLYPPDDEEPW